MRDWLIAETDTPHWQAWGKLYEGVRSGRTVVPQLFGMHIYEYYAAHPEDRVCFSRWMWRLIRLAFRGWRGQQQGTVNRLPQAKSCLNIPPQVGHHYLLIHNAIRSSPSTVSGQRDVNNAIRESECGCYFIKNEWSMRNVANGDYGPLLGARVGLVCHDGSFQFWEWNSERNGFILNRAGPSSSRLDFAALPESPLETAANRFGDERCSETP
jgi:hypothetical protein